MIRQLIEYLPPVIRNVREYKAIMNNGEQAEISALWDAVDAAFNDQFVSSATVNGVERWEKILDIKPKGTDTLDARKSRVLTRWNDFIPYTYRAFIEKMIVLCDGLNFTVNKNFNEYKMEIITHLELSGQVDELKYLFEYMIPANMEITSKNHIYCNSIGQQNIALGMAFCQIFELSDAFKVDFKIQGSSIIGGGIIGSAEVTLSDNFNEIVTVNGIGKTASNASITQILGMN